MSNSPEVSFIIPVYNGARFLPELFHTIEAQTVTNWEAVIVDDSSTDNSWEILLKKQAEDPRFRVFRKPNERYVCRGMAFAIERMKGEWFFYMSQDDKISPDLIEKMLSLMKHPEIDAIVPVMNKWFGNSSVLCPNAIDPGQTISGKEAFLLSINWKITGFTLFRASLWKNFSPDLNDINSDEYDTRRLYFFSRNVSFVDTMFSYHVGNPEAITVKWNIDRTGFLRTSVKLWNFAEENGVLEQAAPKIRTLTADLGIDLLNRYSLALKNGQTTLVDGRKVAETLRSVRFMFRSVSPTQYVTARIIFSIPFSIKGALFIYRIWHTLKRF